MAVVRVNVTDKAVITALNTPGGAVHEWRDMIGQEVENIAFGTSPVNNPGNAGHRGGVTGTYKKGWDWDRRGSSGHHVIARVVNSANHAIFVEFGRSASYKMQIFTWAKFAGEKVRVGGPVEIVTDEEGMVERKYGRRKLSKGEIAFNERIGKLPKRIGSKTSDRRGYHILGRALVAVLGSQGISARVDM